MAKEMFNLIVLKGTENDRERRVKIDSFLRLPLLKRYLNSESKFFPNSGTNSFCVRNCKFLSGKMGTNHSLVMELL